MGPSNHWTSHSILLSGTHSGVMAEAKGQLFLPSKFLTVGELLEIFWFKNFYSSVQNLGLENPIWGNLGAKLKF